MTMDIEVFLDYVDPDWFSHYCSFDKDIAFDQMTQHMTPSEIKDAIRESECLT